MNEQMESTMANQPTAVIAHPQRTVAERFIDQLACAGWKVHRAADSQEARSLAHRLEPEVVVMATDQPEESGWLTCAKLKQEMPEQRVILVAARPTAGERHFASFVGAADLLPAGEDMKRAVERLLCAAV